MFEITYEFELHMNIPTNEIQVLILKLDNVTQEKNIISYVQLISIIFISSFII